MPQHPRLLNTASSCSCPAIHLARTVSRYSNMAASFIPTSTTRPATNPSQLVNIPKRDQQRHCCLADQVSTSAVHSLPLKHHKSPVLLRPSPEPDSSLGQIVYNQFNSSTLGKPPTWPYRTYSYPTWKGSTPVAHTAQNKPPLPPQPRQNRTLGTPSSTKSGGASLTT